MLKRAYALLEVRAVSGDGDAREFEGLATTPTPDRMGDVIDPLGAKFKNPLPLLHQHDSERPIGTVRFKKATAGGIAFVATIPTIAEPGPLKDRVDTAWGEIKAGLVRAVSIGFRVLQGGYEMLADNSGLKFTAIEILELSAVTIPANAQATITNIRSFDNAAPAATGQQVRVVRSAPPASREIPTLETRKGAAMPRTISEQIEDFTKAKATKVARLSDLALNGDKGDTLDAAQAEEFEDLRGEIDTLEKQLERLHYAERLQAKTATPVTRAAPEQTGQVSAPAMSAARVVRTGERLEPGMRMARVTKCIILQKMTGQDPVAAALRDYPNDPVIAAVTKAAVAAGTTMNPAWAGALVGEEGQVYADFVEFLRAQTILGQFGTNGIPDLRHVPFRTPLISQTSGGSGFWVGEGHGKPVTSFAYARTTLEPLKVANISVLTKELIRDSSPKADVEVRNSLVDALRERLDTDFIDPAKAAVAGISPASVTNGVAQIPSSGTDSDALRADIKAAYAAFTQGNVPLRGGVWVMEPGLAASIGMMTNLLGTPEFAGIGQNGESLGGFPVISSDYVPTGIVALLNAPDIYFADEGGFEVAMSDQASIEMSDAPTQNSGTPTASTNGMVSMFQTNSVAILAERAVNWSKRRPGAAVVISGADWGGAGSATLGGGQADDSVRGRAA